MKRIKLLGLALLLVGCQSKSTSEDQFIKVKDINKDAGADSYALAGNNKKSNYYVNLDFYNQKSNDELTIISKFKTMQQTDEWSCGPATILMVLNHYGIKENDEMNIAEKINSHTDLDKPIQLPGSANNFGEYGTSINQFYSYFNDYTDLKVIDTSFKSDVKASDLLTKEDGVSAVKVGNLKPTFDAMSLYTSDNDATSENYVDAKDSYFVKWLTNHLNNDNPIMVEWSDWDGHWQAIIGYDNNGTPGIGDDILIFADPYDTSDHAQDGYYYYPLERWFYMWSDLNVGVAPYQLQQYIVVSK